MKRLLSLFLILSIVISLAGCSVVSKKDSFDESDYIKSVLDCSYLENYDKYCEYTESDEEEAREYRDNTVYNAVVRFFSKYEINASQVQQNNLQVVFSQAYKDSKFSVNRKVATSTGSQVTVNYTVQTTFQKIEKDILEKRELAQKEGIATQEGAEYIDEIIELCKNTLEQEQSYGETEQLTIDLFEDEDGYVSMNVRLFEDIDEAILPF